MFSKRELEGYFCVDHRQSPGITPEQALAVGSNAIPVPAGMLFEAPFIKCSHCSASVVLNPKRTRSRGYCPKCDHYVCDLCEADRVRTGECYPMKKFIAEYVDAMVTGKPFTRMLPRF